MKARTHREPAAWLHPLAGADWRHFFAMIAAHRGYSAKGIGRLLLSAAAITQRWPYSRFEEWGELKRSETEGDDAPADPPVFIIGHWGSGTTWMHQLLASDSRFITPDTGDCLMPHNLHRSGCYFRWYVRHLLPPTRGFDAVPFSMEEPQEEEMALAALCSVSYFHTFFFPRERDRHAGRALFPEQLPETERASFAHAYQDYLARLARRSPGRTLLLKNPASTSRIRLLREWFPGARFIHLVRNPHEVAAAALNRIPYLTRRFGLQPDEGSDLYEHVLATYEAVMRRYLDDRAVLPPGALFETSYESLCADPAMVVGRAREALGMPRDELSDSSLRKTLAISEHYQRQPRPLPAELQTAIGARWRFSFDFWGYPLERG
jgi:hypothetical protein